MSTNLLDYGSEADEEIIVTYVSHWLSVWLRLWFFIDGTNFQLQKYGSLLEEIALMNAMDDP